MKTLKIGVMLLALLLAAMTMVPMVSAMDEDQDRVLVTTNDNPFEPIDQEIHNYTKLVLQERGTHIAPDQFAATLSQKYHSELDQIIKSIEGNTQQTLSDDERNTLKSLIIQGEINKIYQQEYKKKLNISESDFKKIPVTLVDGMTNQVNAITSLPHTLHLVQVYPDVYGGTGVDSLLQPYSVNGNNQIYTIYWDHHPGSYTYYELHFLDEDHPNPVLDITYDEYRKNVLSSHPYEDIQSFIIWADNTIEFVDIWDNGFPYATTLGQHGQVSRSFGSGTYIYISNVWNHAMDTSDRNSDMQKVYYNY